MTARLAGIRLYPIKSLDPTLVSEARLLPGGALDGDRRWALLDADGGFVNGKRHPGIHAIRARFAPGTVTLAAPDHPARTFALDGDRQAIEAWFSACLGRAIRLGREDQGGFPDDTRASGPTFVGAASIAAVTAWFPELPAEDLRRRFRANLELDGVPAFWEDRLFGPAGTVVRFRVGAAEFLGTNPCQRCPVPSRDPDTGEVFSGFQKRFSDRRRDTLPAWAEASRFDHYYRFTVNCRAAPDQAGKMVRIGDAVEILGTEPG